MRIVVSTFEGIFGCVFWFHQGLLLVCAMLGWKGRTGVGLLGLLAAIFILSFDTANDLRVSIRDQHVEVIDRFITK